MTELEVFSAALDVPEAEQDAFLQRACAGDESLYQKVTALLGSHRKDHFIDHPAGHFQAKPGCDFQIGEKPGDRVGRYKLLQQIGEGGWGIVFMAEQTEPVRRRVAIKIVKPGMDTRTVVARFEAERQALALMEHPHIAHVLDAGATSNGRPYFVMELVRGLKITDYCEQNNVPTAERLAVFALVCDAVQHAHQKGIIHRDLKPSNILVTTGGDGKPLPKVIDFGIAKAATGVHLTDKTLFTAFDMLIGTPAYMSPEQAAFTSVDVDSRTDIYSLGVLLYELLTGATPFDARELLKAGLDKVRYVIQTEEPAPPSTRLVTMLAANPGTGRRAGLPELIREVRGDLDWIVMKALEKDRVRRYPTANGLALDVRRYLAGEAISAHPPSSVYRLQKLIVRHKLLVSGLCLFIVSLISLLALMSVLFVRERELREKSELMADENLVNAYIWDRKPELAEPVFLRAVEMHRQREPAYLPHAESFYNLFQLYLDLGEPDKAEGLSTKFLELSGTAITNDYSRFLFERRADARARQGHWAEAIEDAEDIRKRQPDDYNAYHMLAPLMVASQNLAGYQLLCRQIQARFPAATSATMADRLAKDCLILPSSGVDLDQAARLADFATSQGEHDVSYAFYECCKALAEYRQGHFESAEKWSQLAEPVPFPYTQAEAFAILSMAQFQMKDGPHARATLAKCDDLVQRRLPVLGADLGTDWRDWIITRALLTEATRLINPKS